MVVTSSGKPYTQINDIRTFSEDVEDEELIWHRDKYKRIITILEGEDWQLQLDNKLPITLEKEQTYEIPKLEYHRVIKGKGNLKIKIWEER